MRYSFVTAALLLGSALARPYDKHEHGGHHDDSHSEPDPHAKPSKSSVLPSGTGTGYGSITFPTRPAGLENHGTASHPLETSPEINAALPEKYKDTSSLVEDDGEEEDKDCDAPKTVTSQNVVTVTVPAGGSDAAPSTPPSKAELTTPSKSEDMEDTKPEDSEADITEEESSPATPASSSAPPASSTPAASSGELEETTPIKEETAPTKEETTPTKEETTPTEEDAPAPSSAAETDDTKDETPTDGNSGVAASGSTAGAAFRTKRGIIASGDGQDALAAVIATGKISWLADWYSAPPKTFGNKASFVPQMYHTDSDDKGEWTRNAADAIKGKFGDGPAKYFISFGEPGTPGDHQVDPAGGVTAWNKHIEPYAKQGVKLGAPTTLQNKQDFEWLDGFLTQCTGCSVGFLDQHWFDKAAPLERQVNAIKGTLQQAKEMGEKHGIKDIWLDNFQADGTAEEQKAFLSEILPWLDAQDWIKAYAYHPPDNTPFNEGNGLSELAKHYANV